MSSKKPVSGIVQKIKTLPKLKSKTGHSREKEQILSYLRLAEESMPEAYNNYSLSDLIEVLIDSVCQIQSEWGLAMTAYEAGLPFEMLDTFIKELEAEADALDVKDGEFVPYEVVENLLNRLKKQPL
jgi:hypothetical protein